MYDIIGDIHGHADELKHLLGKIGYELKNGSYSHPDNRTVIFVGDYIDRGPKIRETLHLVKAMCDSGRAKAIMGNHEFNAICYHTPAKTGGYLRSHSHKNQKQHSETLRAFAGREDEWAMYLEWFRILPLYLDLEPLRAVHACWDQRHINWLKNNYSDMTPAFLQAAADKSTEAYTVIDEQLKGKEKQLPDGLSFLDKDGHKRTECRIKWWIKPKNRNEYRDIYLGCPDEIVHSKIDTSDFVYRYDDDKPVFFGHYWLRGRPALNGSQAVCLDYSVAKGGKLVAYRWNGPKLANSRFVW